MVENIIHKYKNKFIVLFFFVINFRFFWAVKNTNLDALPDLSPPQVIIQVEWNGKVQKQKKNKYLIH